MQRGATAIWKDLIHVAESRPQQGSRAVIWLWCAASALVGVGYLFALSTEWQRLTHDSSIVPSTLIVGTVRALLVVVLALWLPMSGLWHTTNSYEKHQGNIVATITLFLLIMVASLMWLDVNIYRYASYALLDLIAFVTGVQIIWLVRTGYVRLAGALLLSTIIVGTLESFDVHTEIQRLANPLLAAMAVLMGGMLIHWVCGLAMALTLPLATAFLRTMSGLELAVHPGEVLFFIILLLALAAIVTLYARSLERALRNAEARDAELTAAEAALREQNIALQHQTDALHATQGDLRQTVADQERRIATAVTELRQRSVELSSIQTPLIPVARGVLVVPLIGAWDEQRADAFTQDLLHGVERQRVHTAVLDLTGLAAMSEGVARMMLRVVTAMRLLGCRCVLVGVQPESAQSLVSLGIDLSELETGADLAAGVALSLKL